MAGQKGRVKGRIERVKGKCFCSYLIVKENLLISEIKCNERIVFLSLVIDAC